MPKRAGVIWTHEKPSCFSQTPFRAERDARMSEMAELKRKLARIGDRGCKVPVYVAQNIIFPTSTELAVLKQTMSQSWYQSSVIDTHNPTVHRTDACVSHNPEDTWGHTPPGLQIFLGRRTLG